MTDTGATADYKSVDGAVASVVESRELSRRLKGRIYQTIEEREDITLDQTDEIAQAVEVHYLNIRVDPLDPVGTASAQSIGEPGARMTMNTFRYAGIAEIDVTQGLSRLIELANARKTPDTPMMTVYLEDEYANNRKLAHQVVWNIESTKIPALGDIPMNVADMVAQVSFNNEMPLERWLAYDGEGVVTSETAEIIEGALGIKTRREGTPIEFGPENPNYHQLLQLVEELRGIVFRGIEEVSRVIIRKENNEDTDEKRFVLCAEGSAFGGALAIEDVDVSRTTSDNIHEVHKQLGIEAAREAIIDRTMNTLREQGLDNVNIRHLMLVADIVTNDRTIEPIDRHDISGSKDSVLACAAFGVTVNHLLGAAIYGEEDDLDGIIENVIVGKSIAIGTDDVDPRMGSLDVEDADANAAPEPSDD